MSTPAQIGPIEESDRAILEEVLNVHLSGPTLPRIDPFRAAHFDERDRLDRLEQSGLLDRSVDRYRLTLRGLRALGSPTAESVYRRCSEILHDLQTAYVESQHKRWTTATFGNRFHLDADDVSRLSTLLVDNPWFGSLKSTPETSFVSEFSLTESVLDATLPDWPDASSGQRSPIDVELEPLISGIEISGYRPFSGFSADLGALTVIIGANATGKSSLFDAIRLLSQAVENPLPPEIDPRNPAATKLFHAGGPERIDLTVKIPFGRDNGLRYDVSIQGPVGTPKVAHERLATKYPLTESSRSQYIFMKLSGGTGSVMDGIPQPDVIEEWSVPPNELALRRALSPRLTTIRRFREFVAAWRCYSGFDVGPRATMRQPAYIDENPVLAEDGSNLTAVLNSLVLEHREAWEELEMHLRAVIPGFEALGVRPRGARGMAIGTWREHGVAEELTLGDLSEGTLRLLCWLALAFSPNLPPVVLIDEPELGLHPRVLPLLAGAFKLASARSQILIATHSPHFLSQFSLDEIAIMRKEDGRATFVRPNTSDALRHEVEELGGEALAKLFLSEELEVLP